MLDVFESKLRSDGLLKPGDRVVLGVSGGPDSMAMLDLLLEIKEKWSLGLFVVHVNHCFRGELADRDAESVRRFCLHKDVPFYLFKTDVMAKAEVEGLSFEEAGRVVRYEAFEKVRAEVGANRIAVAQNKNDQAETILMRIMRGTGLDGLKGIPQKRGEFIIRPILHMSRQEIEAYCERRGLPVCHDHTNDEVLYTRNKIRHELLPYIEENFNAQIVESLWRMGELVRMDAEYLDSRALECFRDMGLVPDAPCDVSLTQMSKVHAAVQARMIRYVADTLGDGLKDVSYAQVQEVLALIERRRHGTKKNISGVEFFIRYDRLYYHKSGDPLTAQCDPGTVQYRVIESHALKRDELDENEIAVNWDRVRGELRVRFRMDGDRFQPMGMKGTKKLKNFFIDEKVPAPLRDKIPIVCDDEGIVWVVGYRVSERLRVDKDTSRVGIVKWSDGC